MKQLRSTLVLLVLALVVGGYIYWKERGPMAAEGSTVLLRTQPDSVGQITLLASGGKGAELRRAVAGWSVRPAQSDPQGPPPVPADADAVTALLKQLQLVQSSQVVDQPSALGVYGLDHPSSTISVDGTTLRFGNRPKFDAGKIYVGSGPTVALVDSSLADNAAKPLTFWRDKHVLTLAPDALPGFTLQLPGRRETFLRQGTAWHLTQPLQALADAGAVNSFLSSLADSQSSTVLDANGRSLARWGLDRPRVTLQTDAAQLRVGRKVAGGYAAQNSLQPTVFTLNAGLFAQLVQPLATWRDKHLAPPGATDGALRLDVQARHQARSLTLVDGKWQLARNMAGGAAEPRDVNTAGLELLTAAQGWQASTLIDPPWNRARYGLDRPDLVLTYTTGASHTLKLARRLGHVFAGNDSGTLFVLSPDALERAKNALDLLMGPAPPAAPSTHPAHVLAEQH